MGCSFARCADLRRSGRTARIVFFSGQGFDFQSKAQTGLNGQRRSRLFHLEHFTLEMLARICPQILAAK
jgi:hypothetical protein